MGGHVLDERSWGFDNVCVEPEHPGCEGPDCGEEERVSGCGHLRTPLLLGLQGVSVLLELGDGGVVVLSEDCDFGELGRLGILWALHLLDGCLQFLQSHVSFLCSRHYEAEFNELSWVRELEQVLPVVLVEICHRREDEDLLAVLQRVLGCLQVVEVVMRDVVCGEVLWCPAVLAACRLGLVRVRRLFPVFLYYRPAFPGRGAPHEVVEEEDQDQRDDELERV